MFPRFKVFYLLYCIILVNVVFLQYHLCVRIKLLEMPAIQKSSNNCDNVVDFLHVKEKRLCMRLAPFDTLQSTCCKKNTKQFEKDEKNLERLDITHIKNCSVVEKEFCVCQQLYL